MSTQDEKQHDPPSGVEGWPTLTVKQIDDALEFMANPEIVPTDVLYRALYEARWAVEKRPLLEALTKKLEEIDRAPAHLPGGSLRGEAFAIVCHQVGRKLRAILGAPQ